jgi:hypothetical protein
LAAGYNIPLTASTTNWNGFYDVPSTRISAGTNLSWSGNTLNGPADSYIRGLLSSSATGLSYNNSTGVFSLTAGYNIPLTASTTNWNNFYNTPSTQIAAGTGLSWSGNTLNAANAHTGTGTTGYVTRWLGANALGTGVLYDNGTVAGVNATTSNATFTIKGNAGAFSPLVVTSSTGTSLLTIGQNGSTTLSSLGSGIVRSASGSLYNGLVANADLVNSSLTVTAGSGTTVMNAPTAMLVPVATGAASCVAWIYYAANTKWYRVQ